MSRCLFAVAGLLATVMISFPATASAAPPPNDAFASATAISSLPFSDAGVVIDQATMEPGESLGNCTYGSSNAQTVWYTITPTSSGILRIADSSSFYYQFIAAYQQNSSGLGGLTNLGCASWAYGQNIVTVNVDAGSTYYIQAGSNFASSGTIGVSIQLIPPPANDNFVSATAIGSVPFSDSVDTTAASVEPGEPTPACGSGQSAGTVWYAFTPSVSGSYSASTPWSGFYSQVAAYTGAGLGTLSQIGCRTFGQTLTFHADAGTTYHLQVGGLYGARGTVSLALDVAPAPVAGFYYYPSDPSSFDTIQFGDQSYDPAQVGFASHAWTFGDGASASASAPTHVYTADGDYSVKLVVATTDGRTASISQVVHVRTNDVAITKLTVPQSAGAGQTRTISVGLTDTHYPEAVQVQLLKSGPAGWTTVGTLTQSVPVRGANRTTEFAFTYTFTPDDATLGKISFRAIATIQGARDALPADNDVTALPTKVS
jgi:PKD repeat protein